MLGIEYILMMRPDIDGYYEIALKAQLDGILMAGESGKKTLPFLS
ncbi:Protein phosphatase 2C 3 [Venturia inaequalis]|nr:Protein phosphatase 2C 3 [Venturia inaequalis]